MTAPFGSLDFIHCMVISSGIIFNGFFLSVRGVARRASQKEFDHCKPNTGNIKVEWKKITQIFFQVFS